MLFCGALQREKVTGVTGTRGEPSMKKTKGKIGQRFARNGWIRRQAPWVVLLVVAVLGMTALSTGAAIQGFDARQQRSVEDAVAEASAATEVTASLEAAAHEQAAPQQDAEDAKQLTPAVITEGLATSAQGSSAPTPSKPSAPIVDEPLPIDELNESEVLALSDDAVVENAAAIVDSQEVGNLIALAQEELGRDFTDEELELLASGIKAQYAYDQALADGRAEAQQFTAEEQAAIDQAASSAAALEAEATQAMAQAETVQAGGGLTPLAGSTSSVGLSPGGRYSPGVGVYPTTKGKILVTADWFKSLLPTGHAALVINQSSAYTALSNGVTVEPNDWYNPDRHQTAFGLDVTKTNATQEAKATDWCAQHVGKPYNYIFVLPSRTDAYYCSSLIWQAYQKTCNVNLNTSAWSLLGLNIVHPMEFVDSSQTTLLYRQGTAHTGWQTVNGVRYYIDANGNPR
jgi:hypothetical protein